MIIICVKKFPVKPAIQSQYIHDRQTDK